MPHIKITQESQSKQLHLESQQDELLLEV